MLGVERFGGSRLVLLATVVAFACENDSAVPPGSLGESARAVTATSPLVGDFALYGRNSVAVNKSAVVGAGDVGTHDPGGVASTLPNGVRVSIDQAQVASGHRIFGASVLLGKGAQVGDVYTNQLTDKGATRGQVFPFPA